MTHKETHTRLCASDHASADFVRSSTADGLSILQPTLSSCVNMDSITIHIDRDIIHIDRDIIHIDRD
ncbi:hypothetical protein BGX24_002725 [Mortierella sp. AD032]|nr:hypothetical protein BGX24_002725 [Mortierella sp. AD032]